MPGDQAPSEWAHYLCYRLYPVARNTSTSVFSRVMLSVASERKLAMKIKFASLAVVVLALLVSSVIPVLSQTVVGFDDLSETASGSFIANGYNGLNWDNFLAVNAPLSAAKFGTNGVYYGMVSAPNVALSGGGGNAAEIDSPGTNFDFLSTYLTAGIRTNLNIEVEGFSGTNLIYDQTVVASVTNPTLFTFNYLNINSVHFSSFGGEPELGTGVAENFAMDNFDFEFVPEPSALLLAAMGGISLVALLRRKRV
jgi:hypothetical protein